MLTPKGDSRRRRRRRRRRAGQLSASDFRVAGVLAWLGRHRRARATRRVDVKLPESLTTYRIMAVAGDRSSRFGSADTEIRINKPVTLKAAFPRFLAVGDKASFGAVVTSQLKTPGPATVTIESLDPDVMQFADTAPQTVDVPAGGSVEVRFEAAGRAIGRARVRMTVKLAGESDAFEDVDPGRSAVIAGNRVGHRRGGRRDADRRRAPDAPDRRRHRRSAACAWNWRRRRSSVSARARAISSNIRTAARSSADRARSRCCWRPISATRSSCPASSRRRSRPTVQSALKELERFQCEQRRLRLLARRVLEHVAVPDRLPAARLPGRVGSEVHGEQADARARLHAISSSELAEPPPTNESWWPSYTAWQAFAVKVLVEGGRNQDSNITRLYGYRERMPVFASRTSTTRWSRRARAAGPRADDLRRRMANAILPEAATAHVEELSDPYLLWFWNSNIRSTAIVLSSMVKANRSDAPYASIVRWLLQARKKGRWGNTQENALGARSAGRLLPPIRGDDPELQRGGRTRRTQPLAREEFRGRSTEAQDHGRADDEAPRVGTAPAPSSRSRSRERARARSSIRRGFATPSISCSNRGSTRASASTAAYAPYVENGHAVRRRRHSRPATWYA